MNKNYLIVKLQGGFGNQLFQISNAISLSKKYDKKIILDLSSYYFDFFSKNTKRDFELDFLNLGYQKSLFKYYNFKLAKFFNINIAEIKEQNFNFKNITLKKDITYILNGYWQSYKYFQDFSLKYSDFKSKIKLNKRDESILKLIKNSNSICVHIRRGDYQNLKTSSFHGIAPIEYYKSSLLFFQNKFKDCKFFFFSDDIDFLKVHFNDFYNSKIVSNSDFCLVDEFFLMMNCKNFIIANSSFSWWSAWLSPEKNKTVIAPKKWFNQNIDTSDLIPDNWVRL